MELFVKVPKLFQDLTLDKIFSIGEKGVAILTGLREIADAN
jgi:hypothetical protein